MTYYDIHELHSSCRLDLKAVAYSSNCWLAGFSRGLGLLMAYGGWWRLATA